MRFMLLKQRDKLPVAMADVTKVVLGEKYKGVRMRAQSVHVRLRVLTHAFARAQMKLSGELIKRASDICRNVFGFRVEAKGARRCAPRDVPIVSLTAPRACPRAGTAKLPQYFLVNDIPLHDPHTFLGWELPSATLGLAAAVLGMLHCTPDGRLNELDLWKAMAALGFHEERAHPVFGDWKKVISKELVSMRYLKRDRVKDPAAGDVVTYSIGARAFVESGVPQTEALVSEVYGRAVDQSKIDEKEVERGLRPSAASAQPARVTRSQGQGDEQGRKKTPASAHDKRQARTRSKFADDEDDDDDDE